MSATGDGTELSDRMPGHDRAATAGANAICASLDHARLGWPSDIRPSTLRDTLDQIVFNAEAWTAWMVGTALPGRPRDRSVPVLAALHEASWAA